MFRYVIKYLVKLIYNTVFNLFVFCFPFFSFLFSFSCVLRVNSRVTCKQLSVVIKHLLPTAYKTSAVGRYLFIASAFYHLRTMFTCVHKKKLELYEDVLILWKTISPTSLLSFRLTKQWSIIFLVVKWMTTLCWILWVDPHQVSCGKSIVIHSLLHRSLSINGLGHLWIL